MSPSVFWMKKLLVIWINYPLNENWQLKSIDNNNTNTDYAFYVGNIEDEVDLEKIKMERPLKKLDINEFEKMTDSLKWEQSIEELLEVLKQVRCTLDTNGYFYPKWLQPCAWIG